MTPDIESPHRLAATVLVVEDDPPLLQMASHVLRAAGFEVVAVPSAEEAHAALEENPAVDVVFTDVMLPGISGLDLAAALGPERSVVLTTGQREADIWQAIEDSGRPALAKPYTAEALVEAVNDGIGRGTRP